MPTLLVIAVGCSLLLVEWIMGSARGLFYQTGSSQPQPQPIHCYTAVCVWVRVVEAHTH
jgi:hypothetical protein